MADRTLKIKVMVDGKHQELDLPGFGLSGESEATEQIIREAAKRINGTLFEYKQRWIADDPFDPLRRTALKFAAMVVQDEIEDSGSIVASELSKLEVLLDNHLTMFETEFSDDDIY